MSQPHQRLEMLPNIFLKKILKQKTKFSTLVDLKGASAQALLNALSKALTNAHLNIKDVIGFGADTTNIMFSEQGGIIAKIYM